MTAYFGTAQKEDGEDDPWDFLDAAPAIPKPLPLTKTDTEDDAASVKLAPAATAPATKPTGAAKRKPKVSLQKDLLEDLCSPKEAVRIYPSSADTLKETGIPVNLQVKQKQRTTGKGGLVYLCLHEKCQMPTFWAKSPAGLHSHVRHKHFGIMLACPYCPEKLYWNSKGWKSHMEHQHPTLPAYGSALWDEAAVAKEMLTSMEKQSSSTKPPAKKHRWASSPKIKSEPKHPEPEEEPSSVASDTEDSSADSSSESASEVKEAKETTERSLPASALLSDKQASAVAAFILDMSPLEENPPPKFPEHAKSGSKKCKKQQNWPVVSDFDSRLCGHSWLSFATKFCFVLDP